MTSFLENLTHTETIDTATTTSSPSGTTVRRVSESYPIRMRSLSRLRSRARRTSSTSSRRRAVTPALHDRERQRNADVLELARRHSQRVRAPQPDERRYHAVGRPRQRGLCRVRLDGLLLSPQARRSAGWVTSDQLLRSC